MSFSISKEEYNYGKESPVKKPLPKAKFTIGYMQKNEEIAMLETPEKGCWYCGEKVCHLTHKYDNHEKAQYPERNPYC